MNITLLCNAGLAVEYEGETLFIDLPNEDTEPFVRLSDLYWRMICERSVPYCNVCGFFFTHDHPDHLDRERLSSYLEKTAMLPVFIPNQETRDGKVRMGPFTVHYYCIEHAPMPMAPPHVAAVIEAGEHLIYVSGDAKLDSKQHKKILGARKVDAAFWNSMYLSRAETRELMQFASNKNYIYHMPLKPDSHGLWKKCDKNFERYGEKLKSVKVLCSYPTLIHI